MNKHITHRYSDGIYIINLSFIVYFYSTAHRWVVVHNPQKYLSSQSAYAFRSGFILNYCFFLYVKIGSVYVMYNMNYFTSLFQCNLFSNYPNKFHITHAIVVHQNWHKRCCHPQYVISHISTCYMFWLYWLFPRIWHHIWNSEQNACTF